MEFFKDILSIDSTSGKERDLAQWLLSQIKAEKVESFELPDGSINLLFSWGEPKVVFCTHLDTVPPYIPPIFEGNMVKGRGACDAKGQIYAMYLACCRLEQSGKSNFGLLLLSGEECGSIGAKAFATTDFRAPYLVVGEPTDNCMVSAAKGTKAFELHFKGKAFHSGYPEFGQSAVDLFVNFMEKLRKYPFPEDALLGATTFNVGRLRSDNPQNVLSPALGCRLYFRTTFASDALVASYMEACAGEQLEVIPLGGDAPSKFFTLEGIPSKTVAFGSDAPQLGNFTHKMICGPGSIKVAHTDNECISLEEIEQAVDIYTKIYESCN